MLYVASRNAEYEAISMAGNRLSEHEILKTSLALFGIVALATLADWASLAAPPAATRAAALILRSAYEDTAGETVRQYRVALRRENKAELCVFAGMIASAYADAKHEHTALSWQQQESLDCAAAGMQRLVPPAR